VLVHRRVLLSRSIERIDPPADADRQRVAVLGRNRGLEMATA
jgi:hypothetical protein